MLYLVSLGPLASVCLFIVLSFGYRFIVFVTDIVYRNIVGTVFLIVSFSKDNSETFGTISIPTIFLSTFLTVLV